MVSPLIGQSYLPNPLGWRWDYVWVYSGPHWHEMVLE